MKLFGTLNKSYLLFYLRFVYFKKNQLANVMGFRACRRITTLGFFCLRVKGEPGSSYSKTGKYKVGFQYS